MPPILGVDPLNSSQFMNTLSYKHYFTPSLILARPWRGMILKSASQLRWQREALPMLRRNEQAGGAPRECGSPAGSSSKQKAIARSNQRENAKRIDYRYKKGGWAAAKRPGIARKLCAPKEGPFQVAKHHGNGTATYEREPFVEGRVNIRRISPYKWKNEPPKD